MHSDPDVTQVVRAWLRADARESADRVLGDVLAMVDHTSQRRSWNPTRRLAGMKAAAGLAVAAAAVVGIVVGGLALLPGNTGVGGPPPASPSVAEPSADGRIVGLPPEGATPSSTEPGELVLRFEGYSAPGWTMWVYRDGRLILARIMHRPANANAAYIGLTEQRLTPSGVEFLRAGAIASGLFEGDLMLAREGKVPSFDVQVHNGERLVRVIWASRGIAGPNARDATPEQERALRALDSLLISRSSWPPSAWADQVQKSYVPSEYSICFGVRARDAAPGTWAGPFDQARILAVLPDAAQDLLRTADPARQSVMHADAGCSRATTDDARLVARILDGAGLQREPLRRGEYWLAYQVEDPRLPGYTIWIQFGPVLPHGEATWLGPG